MNNNMKRFIAATASLALTQASHAATLTWDTTIAADAVITDGGGTWTTGLGNWNDGDPTTPTSVGINWADGDLATFGGGTEGTAGTVTLGSNITTSNLTSAISVYAPFDGSYTFDLATFTLQTGGFKLFGGSAPVIVNSTGGGVLELNATRTWSITNGPLTVNAQITGAFGLNKFGGGHMFLTNDDNSFTGDLQLNNSGDTTLTSIKDSGVPSAAGAGSGFKLTNNADLIYIGSGDSTNRTLELGNSSSQVHSSGTGALIFTGTIANTSTNAKTLTIKGTNTDANEIQGPLIDSSDAGQALSVTKTDAGSWTLSGDNSYTGTTTVSAGTLTLTGNNTTTGITAISGNSTVLNINSDTALGTGTLTILNAPTISNTSGGLVTIPNAVTLSGSPKFNSTNDLVIDGDVTLTANRTLNMTTPASTAVTLNGVISDGGSGYSLSKTGGGNLVLTNPNNSFTGLLSMNNGRSLSVSSIGMSGVNSAAGAGSQINFGFNTTLTYTGSGDTSDRTLNMFSSSTSNITNNGTGALVLTGAFTNAQAGTKVLALRGSNSDANEIASVLIDSTDAGQALSVLKANAGNWILSGNNTYSGGTKVESGTLLINNTTGSGTGTGSVQVDAGTLGGDGSISGAVTIGNGAGSADAILAPGNSIGSIDTGDLVFASDGSYFVEVDGTLVTADQTNVTGTVTIDAAATLAVSVTGTLVDGQQYTIIANDGADAVTGTFAGLAEGATVGTFGAFDLTISYVGGDGNDVVLSAVTGSSTPYETWSGGEAFDTDTNGDGVDNGLAWILGAPDEDAIALAFLPTGTENSGGLVMTFTMENPIAPSVLSVEYTDDLTDVWTSVVVPTTSGTVDDLIFNITGSDPYSVEVTIPSSKASLDGELFGRLSAVESAP